MRVQGGCVYKDGEDVCYSCGAPFEEEGTVVKDPIVVRVHLSRRNLTNLLAKLDNGKDAILTKRDYSHPEYPIEVIGNNGVICVGVEIVGVENEPYYANRMPGGERYCP